MRWHRWTRSAVETARCIDHGTTADQASLPQGYRTALESLARQSQRHEVRPPRRLAFTQRGNSLTPCRGMAAFHRRGDPQTSQPMPQHRGHGEQLSPQTSRSGHPSRATRADGKNPLVDSSEPERRCLTRRRYGESCELCRTLHRSDRSPRGHPSRYPQAPETRRTSGQPSPSHDRRLPQPSGEAHSVGKNTRQAPWKHRLFLQPRRVAGKPAHRGWLGFLPTPCNRTTTRCRLCNDQRSPWLSDSRPGRRFLDGSMGITDSGPLPSGSTKGLIRYEPYRSGLKIFHRVVVCVGAGKDGDQFIHDRQIAILTGGSQRFLHQVIARNDSGV